MTNDDVFEGIEDCLSKASDEDNDLQRTMFYGHQAICIALVGMIKEFRQIRTQLENT